MKNKNNIFSIEEIISLNRYDNTVINNDGTYVAYEVSSTDWKEDKYINELWLYDALRDSTEQLISKNEFYVGNAKWSPNGNYLAMLIKDNNESQIFIIDIKNRKKEQVSLQKNGVNNFIWSADSKGFYYLSSSSDLKSKEKRDKKYGVFTYVDEEISNNSLFYLDLKKGIDSNNKRYVLPEDLIKKSKKDMKNDYYPANLLINEKDLYIHKIVASNDNKKIAITTAKSSSMEDYDKTLELCIYDIDTKTLEKVKIDDFSGNVLFSPDSSKICFSVQSSWLLNNKIVTYDLNTKEMKKLEIDIDEVKYITHWLEKGMVIYYQDKVSYKYCLLNNQNNIETILDEDSHYYSLDFDYSGKNKVYIERSKESFAEIYFNNKKIVNRSSLLKGKKYAKKEMISWINKDGVEIEGVLSTPKDFDNTKKYPLLVIIHGGPSWASFPYVVNDGLYPLETFIDKGFITLEPNYRGSSGYGEKFRSSNFKNLGLGDFEDVISGVDYLIDLGFVDKDRLGVMGWSQGGYISAFCATYTDRFKAISIGAGISDWTTYYYNTDIPNFTKEYLGNVPFKDKEIYEKTSPINYVNNAKTPVLIQHGGSDFRVPVANAYELYRALKELNLDPKLVIYENMNHVPYTPGFKRAINLQNLKFFCHHLLGEDIDGFYLNEK